jgi:hypothetical protein
MQVDDFGGKNRVLRRTFGHKRGEVTGVENTT